MKKEIHHKDYRPVLFVDNSNGVEYIIPSAVATKEKAVAKTGEHKGKEFPVFYVEISSSSHPFYTGQEKVLDSAGRVERFREKQKKAKSKK